MKEKKELKRYLVKKFLWVLLGIVVCEIGINMLCTYWIFPVLREYIGGPFFENFAYNGSGTVSIYILFFWMIAEFFLSLFPNVAVEPVLQFLMSHFQMIFPKEFGIIFYELQDNFLDSYCLGCFVIVVLLFLFAILPYLAGGLLFSRLMEKETQRMIAEEQKQHQEYERKRNLMLSDIAHDLKTPMTTVSGYAQALRDGMITDEKKREQYLDAICTKSHRMDDLLALLFEYVKIDSEGFRLHKERKDIVEVLRENIALFYADFEQRGIEVELDILEQQIMWEIDQIQFSRVLANLLNNELRHAGSGQKLLIRLRWEEEEERLQILFGDTGEQIDDGIAAHLFEPFVMGDASRNSKGGSGLGLSIASKIVKMHGGMLILDRNSTKEYTKAFVIVLQ